jgi:drug/metabolite transporter (DMT)-like permease
MTLAFWLWIVVIIVFGTLGGVAFKYGTNQVGEITLQKLMQFEITKETILYGLIVVIGLVLFFVGGYHLGGRIFAARYLFTPIILVALVLLFLSRFLIGVPLSTTGLGRLTSILTSLTIVSTAAASALVFKETYGIQVLVGIALGIVAVILIGQG